jgi:hypothetical protein
MQEIRQQGDKFNYAEKTRGYIARAGLNRLIMLQAC